MAQCSNETLDVSRIERGAGRVANVILRDPVHGLLAFESEEASIVPRLLDAVELQRLRRIKQLGVTALAFPGAEHTRFVHALGAAHVMQRLLRRLRENDAEIPFWHRVSTDRAQDAIAAALLHDVGHGPLSHSIESAFPNMPHHEVWSSRIVLDPSTEVNRILSEGDAGRPHRVAELIHGRHELPYLARAVSGTFDVDRCDYILRDAYSTGVRYGSYDLDWLLRSLRFGLPKDLNSAPPLAIDGAKGLVAIEQFILARWFMFQQVYLHKATRAAEWMIRRVLSLAAAAIADGDHLSQAPRALTAAGRGQELSLGEYIDLDDIGLWGAFDAWRQVSHPQLSDLCRRLKVRALFKTLELFKANQDPTYVDYALTVARDIARKHGLDPDVYVGVDVAEETLFDPQDDPPVVIFAKGAPRPLIDVSFLLARLAGEKFRKIRLVFAHELRDAVVEALPQ